MKKKHDIIVKLFILLITFFFFSFLYNSYVNRKMEVSFKGVIKTMPITYTVVDNSVSSKDIKISNVEEKYSDSVLYFIPNVLIELYEDGNYYTGKLPKNIINKNIADYSFTMNNLMGEIIDDCKFDGNVIKIPKKYYKKGAKRAPIQMQIITMNSKKKIQKHTIEVNIKGKINKNKKINVSGFDTSTMVSITKYKSGRTINKKDISVYINGSKNKLKDSLYEYNANAGTIEIGVPSLSISNIQINIKRTSIIKNFITSVSAKSYSYSKMNAAGQLSKAPTGLSVGSTFKINNTKVAYKASDGKIYGDATVKTKWNKIEDNALYYDCDDEHNTCNSYTSGEDYFAISLSAGSISNLPENASISFSSNTFVKMYCANHTTPANASDNPNVWFNVKVLEITSNYIILQFSTTDNFFTQSPRGVLKFTWDESDGRIKLKKYLYGNGNRDQEESKENFGFTLYDDATDCSKGINPVVTQKFTNDNSNINWRNLAFGDYYVKETTCDSDKYICDTSCHKVVLNENDAIRDSNNKIVEYADESTLYYTRQVGVPYDGTDYYMPTNPVINYKRYVCFNVTKSSSISGSDVSNISFQSSVGDIRTTTANNPTVTFGPYVMGPSYTYKEISSNALHFNDNSVDKAAAVSEATYSFGGNTTVCTYYNNTECTSYDHTVNYVASCPNGAANSATDTHRKWCVKVEKVDKVTGELIKDATTKFQLCADSACNIVLGEQNVDASTGVATFMGLTHNGTATTGGSPYYVRETVAPKGYALGSSTPKEVANVAEVGSGDIAKVDSTAASDCPSDPTQMKFEDAKNLINWYKTTEDEKVANGAKFVVRKANSHDSSNNTDEYIYFDTGSDKYITQSDDTSPAAITKKCYKQKGVYRATYDAVSVSDEYVMESSDLGTKVGDETSSTQGGEVCVSGLDAGDYEIIEVQAAQYHTFSDKRSITVSASTSFQSMNSNNQFVNLPTVFEFDKSVTDTDGTQIGDDEVTIVRNGQTITTTLSKLTVEELSKISFNIYNSSGTKLSFKKVSDGVYEYSPNSIDQQGSGDAVEDLHLANSLDNETKKSKLIVYHLPWGTNGGAAEYSIKEADTTSCGITTSGFGDYPTLTGNSSSSAPACGSGQADTGSCIGYYAPKGTTSHKFSISQCSNDGATATGACTSHANSTQALENIPTEVKLTKADLYEYENAADVQDKNRDKDESEVKFENAQERSDFDRIDFKVKDSAGNYLNFIYVGNHGDCVTDDENSYSIYRYVPGLQLSSSVNADVFNSEEGGTTQTLHTCGGHMRVINLCRGNNFTFEEVKVPEDSVYVKEVKDNKNPETCFQIPCSGEQNPPSTTTTVIKDKPSIYEVQKRDSKYNYLIPDDTATFRLYQCEKGTECHPGDMNDDPSTEEDERLNAENVRKVIKFYPAQILDLNEESSKDLKNSEGDISGNAMKVYVAMGDSDVDAGTQYTTDVNPYMGRLVFRYLQSGYNYVLVETRSPKNYMLPKGREAETRFNVVNDTVNVEAKDTPNVPTSLLIRKYDKDGDKLLAGAEFKIYKAQNQCNFNQDPWSQVGLKEVKLKTIRDGVYEARPETDTSTIRTCLDKEGALCSEIPTNTQTRLTDLEYAVGSETANEEDTWADFENILYKSEENGVTKTEKINLQEGEALVQYLEYGNCYVIEETKAPTGYSLPKKKKDRFTMVQIDDNEQYGHDTSKIFKNTPTPFTFFKYDEFNQPLDGAEFKLQKLNDDKKYEDIAVTEEEKEGELFYKYEGLAEENSNTVMHTNGGKATVYYLPVGQYRIVETKAAPGKELTKNPNIATFFVDDAGNTFGNALVVNKAETKKIIPKNSASAELIVNIQTGQVVIRYGSIILTIVGLIIGLMLLKKKTK